MLHTAPNPAALFHYDGSLLVLEPCSGNPGIFPSEFIFMAAIKLHCFHCQSINKKEL